MAHASRNDQQTTHQILLKVRCKKAERGMKYRLKYAMEYGMCPQRNNDVTTPTFVGFLITHQSQLPTFLITTGIINMGELAKSDSQGVVNWGGGITIL